MIEIEKQINIFLDKNTEKSIINKLRNAGCVFAEAETQMLISEAQSLEDLNKMVEIRADIKLKGSLARPPTN